MGVEFFSMLEASFYTTFRIIFISSSGFILVKSGVNILILINNLLNPLDNQ